MREGWGLWGFIVTCHSPRSPAGSAFFKSKEWKIGPIIFGSCRDNMHKILVITELLIQPPMQELIFYLTFDKKFILK